MKTEKIEEIKAAIEVLTKAFTQEEREIVPRYPYVLVRKIPRGEVLTKHNIILTQQQGKGMGKPIHEGVVIRTWEHKDAQRDSSLSPGDLVIFPQYAGYPANGDVDAEDNIWFIPDISTGDITQVGILGHFALSETEIQKELYKFLYEQCDMDEDPADTTMMKLLQHYDVIPKKVNPRTRIG